MTVRGNLAEAGRRCCVWLVGIYLLLHFSPAAPWLARWLACEWERPAGAATLIVLGGNQLQDGAIGWSSYWRAVDTLRTYRLGQVENVLISGGPVDSDRSIAAEMAVFLRAGGLPADKLLLEERSRSTQENAARTAELLKSTPNRPLYLLTSEFHMRRAKLSFARQGLAVHTVPAADILKRWNSHTLRPSCLYDLGEELAKLAYYRWRGWV